MKKSHAPLVMMDYEILDAKTLKKEKTSRIESDQIDAELEIKIGNKVIKKPFKSYVGNFVKLLNYTFFNVSTTLKETDNSDSTAEIHNMYVKEIAVDQPDPSEYGIWIGNRTNNPGTGLTGSLSANSGIGGDIGYNDYNLQTNLLADGDSDNGADSEMVYGTTSVTFINGELIVNRPFTNSSSSDRNISEIGLVAKAGAAAEYFLIARDGIDDGTNNYVTVPTGDVIDISYKFKVSTASGFTRNFLRLLSSEFNEGNTVESIQDYDGTLETVNFTSARTRKDAMAAATDDDYGIVIGGDVATHSRYIFRLYSDEYKMQSRITNTYMTYGAVTALNTTSITQSDGYSIIGASRDFTNPSTTDSVFVKEAALILKNATTSKYYLISRILVTGTGVDYVTVPPGKILRIKYYLAFPLGNELQIEN